VALYLYLTDQGVDFEAVFVDHGTDWPETYEYLDMFQGWLSDRGLPSITVIRPSVQGSDNLYGHCFEHLRLPSAQNRWCTDKFKLRALFRYYQTPAFDMLGIDFGESHRAKIQVRKGFEVRYPLVEAEIDRAGCESIIRAKGLSPPPKSGCYICPLQRKAQWVELRRKHPCLFQDTVDLENACVAKRKAEGKAPFYLLNSKRPLRLAVNENQAPLWAEDEYPPCDCGI